MQVSLEKAGPCAAKVSFTVPAADFESEVRRALKNLGSRVRMKGFRPGKVPLQVIEKAHGAEVRREAMAHFVQQAYQQAVTENKLKPIGFERLREEQLKLGPDGSFGHEFEVSLRPEIELGQIKSLEVESQLAPTLDQEVEAAIADVKRQRSTPEPAGDEGLPEDGLGLVDLIWVVGEETVLDRKGLRVSPLDSPPGVDTEAYRVAMIGKKEGDEFTLELTVPEGFEREDLIGSKGESRFTIQQAYRLVPPSDEDLFALFKVADSDALQATVRERIDAAKLEQEHRRMEGELMDRIVAAHPIELPERMVEDQAQARLEQARRELTERGVAEEEIEKTLEGQKGAAYEAAKKGMTALFLIQTIAEKEKLLLSREDLDAEYASIAERNKVSTEDVRKYYAENRLVDQMALEVLERKVRAWLREHAVVNDPR